MLETTRGLKKILCSIALCAGLGFTVESLAGTIYVADGQRSVTGNIYVVNPTSGEATIIANLDKPIHAMASDDAGLIYAITNNHQISSNDQLVTINPFTGVTTLITTIQNNRMSGLAWVNGGLIGLQQGSRIYDINTVTGAITNGRSVSSRRGLANKPGDELFSSSGSTLYRIYPAGALNTRTSIGNLSGRNDTIKDMAYDFDTDTLYGIDFSRNSGVNSSLVSINTSTSAVTQIGNMGVSVIAMAVVPAVDVDNDGMDDNYEFLFGLNTAFDDSAFDPDGDGLTNIVEFGLFSNPNDTDSDDDGLTDDVEFSIGTNLTVKDSDDDGKTDYFEFIVGSNPLADDRILAIGTTVGNSDHSAVATDSSGNVHVVYDNDDPSTDEIFYTMLAADGTVLIGATLISDDDGDQSRVPDVAVANGKVYMVWHSNQYADPEVELAVLDPSLVPQDGSPANPASLITVGPVNISGDDNRKSNHARIAVGTDNKLHVIVEEPDDDAMRYLKLETNGTVIEDVELTDAEDNMRRSFPDIAMDNQNRAHLTWRSNGNDQVWYALVNGDNGEILIDSTVISVPSNSHSSTVSVASDGIVTLVYGVDNETINMIRINPALDDMDGSAANLAAITSSSESILIDENDDNDSDPRHPFARMADDGSMLVSYLTENDEGDGRVKFLTVTPDGTPGLGQVLINNNAQRFEQFKISRDASVLTIATGNEVYLYKNLLASAVSAGASVDVGTLQIVNYPEADLPAGAGAGAPTPHDGHFFSALITLPVGETATLTIPTIDRLPLDSTFEVWTAAGGWVEFNVPNLADATVELTDGGPGDADGVANGFIVIKASALVSGNRSFIDDFLDAGGSLFDDEDNNGTSSGSVGGLVLMLLLANGLFSVVRRRKTRH